MRYKSLLACVFVLAFAASAHADFDYSGYSAFLKEYVKAGKTIDGTAVNAVAYAAIARDRTDTSTAYPALLAQLAAFDPDTLASREEKVAFWINAYNVAAIKLIVDNYPVDSIKAMKISLFSPWGKEVLTVGGRKYSLDTIEHKILLGTLQEPRAHFAVVCASVSCVDLAPEPYRAEGLDTRLDAAAKAFINSGKGIRIDRAGGSVYVSRIFDWGKGDFEKMGGVKKVILWYIENLDDRAYIKDGKYRLKYLDYDWKLNDVKYVK
jgi:hypothetical protein